jgi:hypothetical protein
MEKINKAYEELTSEENNLLWDGVF